MKVDDINDQLTRPGRSVPGAGISIPNLIEYLLDRGINGNKRQPYVDIVDFISRSILTAEEVMILTVNGRLDRLTTNAAKGTRSTVLEGRSFSCEGILNTKTWKDHPVRSLPDILIEEKLPAHEKFLLELKSLGLRSVLMASIRETGFLVVAAAQPSAFSSFELERVKGMASQVAYAVTTTVKRRHLEKELSNVGRMVEMTEKISLSTDYPELLRVTLETIRDVFGGDSGSLMIFDRDQKELKVKAAYGLPREAGSFGVKIGQGIAGWVAKHRKAIVVTDFSGTPKPAIARRGLISAISVPIITRDKLVGVVNIGSGRADVVFSQDDAIVAEKLLARAGAAIYNFHRDDDYSVTLDLMEAFVKIVESVDPYIKGHSENVALYAGAIGEELGFERPRLHTLKLAARMHDFGYAGINPGIFQLRQPLSSVEMVLIKSHPVVGSEAIRQSPRLNQVADIILYHHEHYDGMGYVKGLSGDEIPLESRILAVADAFDAMTSKRSFRERRSATEAIIELGKGAGSQFDPVIVKAFGVAYAKRPSLFMSKNI